MAEAKNKVQEKSALTWEEPPVSRGGRAVSKEHKAIAEALQGKPEAWAKVASGAKNDGLASAIRGGGVSFRTGKFEARSTRREDGTFDVYARYLGPLDES